MLTAIRYPLSARRGYIFLVSVLVIGAIASASAFTLLLLGLAQEQSGFTVVQSVQALELAETCVERAFHSLRDDPAYAGGEHFSLTGGSCSIGRIGGAGNEERTVCVEGFGGDAVRRLEVSVQRLYPSVEIEGWKEVAVFSTACP